MDEQISTVVMAWFLFLLIGGWLLANALIDLGANWLRERLREKKPLIEQRGESPVVIR